MAGAASKVFFFLSVVFHLLPGLSPSVCEWSFCHFYLNLKSLYSLWCYTSLLCVFSIFYKHLCLIHLPLLFIQLPIWAANCVPAVFLVNFGFSSWFLLDWLWLYSDFSWNLSALNLQSFCCCWLPCQPLFHLQLVLRINICSFYWPVSLCVLHFGLFPWTDYTL